MCGNSARTDLCGGTPARAFPTATLNSDVGVAGHDTCHSTLPAGTVTSAAGRRLQRLPEHRVSLEDRCRAVWVAIVETGRALVFVMFDGGRSINDGTIHPSR